MNCQKKVLACLVLFMTFAVACASRAPVLPEVTTPIKEGVKQEANLREAWQQDWDRTLQAAKKEEKVVVIPGVYGSALQEVSSTFKKKLSIEIEIITGRAAEAMARLFSERRAGLYTVDVLLIGSNTFFGQVKPAGIAEPLDLVLILPEVLDTKNWYGGELQWGDIEYKLIYMFLSPNTNLAINTEMVKPGEVKSFRDILNPKWKGKILMADPTIAGSGQSGFSVLAGYLLDLDFFRQLAKQEPVIFRDVRLQVNWLAQGKHYILIFPDTSAMAEFMNAGAPIAYVTPEEGVRLAHGGSGLSLVNRAPHAQAARVLINWMLSREGQTLLSRARGEQSARIDVPTEGLNPLRMRKAGVKYFIGGETEELYAQTQEFVKAAIEIFGQYDK